MRFRGNRFDGILLPELARLVDEGLIRVIDPAIVWKDAAGEVTILELQELSAEAAEALQTIAGEDQGLWAERSASAIRRADGQLLMAERMPHDVVEAARQTLHAAAAVARQGEA